MFFVRSTPSCQINTVQQIAVKARFAPQPYRREAYRRFHCFVNSKAEQWRRKKVIIGGGGGGGGEAQPSTI